MTPAAAAVDAVELAQAHEAGRRRWLPVDLSLELFSSLCVQAAVSVEALRLRPDDLYLAYAGAVGSRGAAPALDRAFFATLVPSLRRVGTPPDGIPDVLQATRERLFTGAQPRLRTYNGIVPLQSWIRLIAVRIAIDVTRNRSAVSRIDLSFATQPADVPGDPATLVAKAQFKAKLEAALRDELARLPADLRRVCRLHFVENESVEAIARRFSVHRVTVARWLWNVGEQIHNNLRRRFETDLGVIATDFESLVRVMRSTMSVDFRGLFDVDRNASS